MYFQLVCTAKGNKFVLVGQKDQQAATAVVKCPHCNKNVTLVNAAAVTFQGNAPQHNLVPIPDVGQFLSQTQQDKVKYCYFELGGIRGYSAAEKKWTADSDPIALYRVLLQPPPASPFNADQFSGVIWALMKISRAAWNEYAGGNTVPCIQAFDRGTDPQAVLNQLVSRYQNIQFFRRMRELLSGANTPAQLQVPVDQNGAVLRPDAAHLARLSTELHGASGLGGAPAPLAYGGMEVGKTQSHLMATWRIMICTGNGGTYAEIVDKLNDHLADCGLNLDQMAEVISCRDMQRATDRLIALLTPRLNGVDAQGLTRMQQVGELVLTLGLLVGALEPARRLSTNAFYSIVFHFWRRGAAGVNAAEVLLIPGQYSIMSGIGTAMKDDDVKHVQGKASRRQKVANIVGLLLRETQNGTTSVMFGNYDLKDLALAIIAWQGVLQANVANVSAPGVNPSVGERHTLQQILALPESTELKVQFGRLFLADLQL